MRRIFMFGIFSGLTGEDHAHQRTYVTGCNRGGDQADEHVTKYFVTPDFPGHYREQLTCKWTVNTNHGKFVKLVPDTFELPCVGNNGLVIEDVGMAYEGAKSVSFCGNKKIPAFVSSDVKFEIHLTIDAPGSRGVRLKLGYKVVKSPEGPKVKQFSVPAFRRPITGISNGYGRVPGKRHYPGQITGPTNIKKIQETPYLPPSGINRYPVGNPSPNWHNRPIVPKGNTISSKITGVERSLNILEESEATTKKELLIIFGYIGLAVLLILPTILILLVIRKNRSPDAQKEPDEENT